MAENITSTPLVSIIIPVYRVEKYLDKCINSVVNQTYENLEIILVDDGSTDNCPQMCDEWARADTRIKVIHKENDGLANARNSGLEIVTGDYFMFADSDDWLEADMIEHLYKTIVKYDADVARCGIFVDYDNAKSDVHENSDVILPNRTQKFGELVNTPLIGGVAWNKLFKSDAFKHIRFDKADGSSEDIMYNFRVFSQTQKVVYYDIPKYHYLIRQESITNSPFGYGAFSIIRAKKIIYESLKNDSELYPICVNGLVTSTFIVLSGVIKNQKCLDRYDELRNIIVTHKKEILKSRLYSKKDKIKAIILVIFPKLFNMISK